MVMMLEMDEVECRPQYDLQQANSRMGVALLLALGIHALMFVLLTFTKSEPLLLPMRVEVQLAQLQEKVSETPAVEQVKPEPAPPKPVPRKPVPRKQPLLTTNAPSPVAVEAQPAPTPEVTEPITETVAEAPAPVAEQQTQTATAPVREATPPQPLQANSEEASNNEAWDGYGKLLQDMVEKHKTYPQIAIRRHLEGRAMVSARFVKGKLIEMVLLEPKSGHGVLDNAALETLKKAISALPVQGDLARKSFTVILPVDFQLES